MDEWEYIQQHERICKSTCFVKESRQTRLPSRWFHIFDIHEKTKLNGWKNDQWWPQKGLSTDIYQGTFSDDKIFPYLNYDGCATFYISQSSQWSSHLCREQIPAILKSLVKGWSQGRGFWRLGGHCFWKRHLLVSFCMKFYWEELSSLSLFSGESDFNWYTFAYCVFPSNLSKQNFLFSTPLQAPTSHKFSDLVKVFKMVLKVTRASELVILGSPMYTGSIQLF